MLSNLDKYRIILASNSPRRKELLAGLDISFEVKVNGDVDESYPEGLSPEEIPMHVAQKKADAYAPFLQEDELLITADTVVWTFEEILGKPSDREDAIKMLMKLSNRVHEVITGVCIVTKNKSTNFSVSSAVSFGYLEPSDIEYYVDKYKPYDKAGSYGIQEWIGYIGAEAINGSFFNVMGLPVQRLYRELKAF
ncbi:MAG: Maf-like protein [Parabacteroides sp.]|jgi:septum formation protein|uniref:Maf-like protein n=1 Tax=Macellibacteroides TaxID=1159323 RepID=UPI00288EA1B2|nr:Maf-like protein [Parabacteroides sp.]MDT3370208.1 Maf-like protein [Bacteroidota bacterium]MEA4809492.1 Maf-like protein [Macellibacteroides fermentans]HNP91358.1 Maf-like protein [Macellibacteroides fermentans]